MIDLYSAATPNGKKPAILLAELGQPWTLHKVDFSRNEQKSPAFLAINPNGKIPALVDSSATGEPVVVIFESGAILEYLAEKAGAFLPKDTRGRFEVLSWVYWQVGGPGPMFGQLGAFGRESPRNEPAYNKFLGESRRLAAVLESRLQGRDWIAGAYSIADIACYPWFEGIAKAMPTAFEGLPRVHEWMGRMAARPAVTKGMALEGASETKALT